MPNPYGREVVSDERYEAMIVEHHAQLKAMGIGPDALCGRCMSSPYDCRCYWPLRESEARD